MNKKEFKEVILEVIEKDGNVLTEIDKESIDSFVDTVISSYEEDDSFFNSNKNDIINNFYESDLYTILQSKFGGYEESIDNWTSIMQEVFDKGVKSLAYGHTLALSLHGIVLESGKTYFYGFYEFC